MIKMLNLYYWQLQEVIYYLLTINIFSNSARGI